MKIDFILYIENGIADEVLTFLDKFIPTEHFNTISTLDICDKISYSISRDYTGQLKNHESSIIREDSDDLLFWKNFFSNTESDHIVKINADTPFLDLSIIKEMVNLHINSLAEYTYSENLPEGFTCEISSRQLLLSIPEVHDKTLPLGKVIKSNINHFDIEIYYKEPDIRDKRINFRTSNSRDKRIMENIVSWKGSIPSYNELLPLLKDNPGVLFIGPSYAEIELTGKCDLDCIFCYRNLIPDMHSDCKPEIIKEFLSGMKAYNLPYTVSFGGSGEPLMNRNFYEIIELACKDPLVSTIIVETNGIYADVNYKYFLENNSSNKITTIININGYNADTYNGIHGKDYFDRVFRNILALHEIPSHNHSLYIQMMKINETEPFIDKYYDFWEKHNISIILQKQNTYLGRIRDRRYSDLSPLDRIPCWHLQRDLYMLSDGKVCFCKQDFDGKQSRGNIMDEPLASIVEKVRTVFTADYKGKYNKTPDCLSCDEWYTFNF